MSIKSILHIFTIQNNVKIFHNVMISEWRDNYIDNTENEVSHMTPDISYDHSLIHFYHSEDKKNLNTLLRK